MTSQWSDCSGKICTKCGRETFQVFEAMCKRCYFEYQGSDEGYIDSKLSEAHVVEGPDLTCPLCHQSTPKTYAGVCLECFKAWALAARDKSTTGEEDGDPHSGNHG